MKKLLTAEFRHETDRFCPEPADMAAYKLRCFVDGAGFIPHFRSIKNEPGAFIDFFGGRDDIELIPVLGMEAMPSGPVTEDVYEYARTRILDALREVKPDGVLLALHGAMVAEGGHDDAEGDLIADVREVVGNKIPIVVTLDLHANVTPKMAAMADALVIYENYPHTDMYETGYLGAQIMEGALSGKVWPTIGYHRIPYLLPMFPTELPEIKEFEDLCKEYEAKDGVLCCRLAHGFFPSDIEEMGMSVVTVTDNDPAYAQKIADTIGDLIWEKRAQLVRHFPTLDEALAMIDEPHTEKGPLVIADASDNPGGGGLCDTTHLLRSILEKGITGVAFAFIRDPESVRKCVSAGAGADVDLMLGGMSDPAFSGGPLPVRAHVISLHEGFYWNQDEMNQYARSRLGLTAVVEIAGNKVLITSNRPQPFDAEVFRSVGIMPERQKALVVKSAVHYRNSYRKFARKLVEVNLPGYVVPVADGLPFRKWKNK